MGELHSPKPPSLKGMYIMQNVLTLQDVIFASALALFFTWLVTNVSKLFKVLAARPAEFNYRAQDLNKILNKCYYLFPMDIIQFRGQTFKRGMNIRITTEHHRIFEGELIGQNQDNMVCLITNAQIIAQELETISQIERLVH